MMRCLIRHINIDVDIAGLVVNLVVLSVCLAHFVSVCIGVSVYLPGQSVVCLNSLSCPGLPLLL